VAIAFGLRNVTDKVAALASMRRVLKPGGKALILEFSKPTGCGLQAGLRPVFVQRAAMAGRWHRQGSRGSYRYLAESIRRFPTRRPCSA
jgi:demethylmenaquinone methyltransferase / 2-methoxy-6-polyprenyl-1,4-benzoquinol methylase